MASSRETALIVAVLALAIANLILVYTLLEYVKPEKKIAPTPPATSIENTTQATRSMKNTTSKVNNTSASSQLNVTRNEGANKTTCIPPVNRTKQYTYSPYNYFLKLEVVSGPDSNVTAKPSLPANLVVATSYIDRNNYSSICEVTMKTSMVMGTAYINVTMPLPGDKCYTVKPVPINMTETSAYYRLELVPSLNGTCGYCAKYTLKIYYLPPGHYLVTIGPLLRG
ncbi:MAG: hypothetical protein JHC26_05035 [Thermofilum sp.]|jgi:hypothetical protein|uniref:hypothetical protein n=1 Tax=Thermofilum sp. TaxID=1961369 RepID=UPI002586FC10|nr:hypothetical protein [Thermofilum sp.]MCI4408434.1 hypothetical protein [Thermofilum sp.]